jgi:feruloyl-CoA synthase
MSTLSELETFAAPDIAIERRADGTIIMRSRHPLEPWEPSIPAVLRARAEAHPDRVLAAQRDGSGHWAPLTFGEARERADALAQALLDLGLGPQRPLMILSGNSLEHLLLTLGAYTAGVPVMPVSVAYSLMSSDHERIRAIAALTEPGLVFADDAAAFAPALDALAPQVPRALVARGRRRGALALDELLSTPPGPAVEEAFGRVGEQTVAKLLFTSGSTGTPKGVINTHRMLCSNQVMVRQAWPFLAHEPPVLVDWLPWSHTFGANHNVNSAIYHGGTLYIDDGRPAPALFERTLAALREVSPSVYLNVPAAYALLAPALESDRELAERFFARLRFIFYAGAALPEALAARLRAIAARLADHEVPVISSWGTTETAPAATSAHFPQAPPGCIGVPLPGCTIKLAPVAGKLEIRVRGPNVTPGYYRAPELTAQAFDEEGFYRSGDAVQLVDERDPNRGLRFTGRIAEDFKLLTGTWVTVGPLRLALLSAAGGVLSDAVICGQDGEYVAALAWLNQAEARRLCEGEGEVAADHPRVRAHLAAALRRLNEGAGSAARVKRLLLLSEPPSLDAGEITDKGYLNQRACLERRAAEVARLYAQPPDPAVIIAAERAR